jgi:hypothetical protein
MGTPGVLLMSALPYIATVVIPAAYSMLPFQMRAPESRAMVLTIGLVESDYFKARRQYGGGPAISFWQGEPTGGFPRLVNHSATRDVARDLLKRMAYGEPDMADFRALEHNDIAACCAARLLLWTHPDKLAGIGERVRGKEQYRNLWRPGKPCSDEKWSECWDMAWAELQRV